MLQGSKIAERLPDITRSPHRHQQEQIAPARPAQPLHHHQHGHQQPGQRETQEQHARQVDALGVGQLGEDRHDPETRSRSNDADEADRTRTYNRIRDHHDNLCEATAVAVPAPAA
jgi:hypothetical protein